MRIHQIVIPPPFTSVIRSTVSQSTWFIVAPLLGETTPAAVELPGEPGQQLDKLSRSLGTHIVSAR
jgi:hypothetical protein